MEASARSSLEYLSGFSSKAEFNDLFHTLVSYLDNTLHEVQQLERDDATRSRIARASALLESAV